VVYLRGGAFLLEAAMNIPSYSKVRAFGHREVLNILDGEIVVQEKIDGSQFSFGVLDSKLVCRSKGQEILIDAPEKMFGAAVETAKRLAPNLQPGWIYRGEYLQRPKHNVLAYSRVPAHHIILFDVMTGVETYLSRWALALEAARLGLESVPVYFQGRWEAGDSFSRYLCLGSVLGGVSIEGVVIKNYAKFTEDGKLATAKIVSDEFKERHTRQWKISNPGPADVVQHIVSELRTDARFRKAVQHLKERGELKYEPEDIGKLLKELGSDTHAEESEHIKEVLFRHFWPKIQRALCAGVANWYKDVFLPEYHEWLATIQYRGPKKHLDLFDTQEDAARAYDAAAKELFGEFACPNSKKEIE
jgi:hypothetical protein